MTKIHPELVAKLKSQLMIKIKQYNIQNSRNDQSFEVFQAVQNMSSEIETFKHLQISKKTDGFENKP